MPRSGVQTRTRKGWRRAREGLCLTRAPSPCSLRHSPVPAVPAGGGWRTHPPLIRSLFVVPEHAGPRSRARFLRWCTEFLGCVLRFRDRERGWRCAGRPRGGGGWPLHDTLASGRPPCATATAVAADKIGFIGLGNMGGPMAANAAGSGHELMVFDGARRSRRYAASHLRLTGRVLPQ